MVPVDVWKCLELSVVDLGQLPFDAFATGQPTDHFALSRYNDRISSGPQFTFGHLSTFIMPSFGSKLSIHIVSDDLSPKGHWMKLPIEPGGVKVT